MKNFQRGGSKFAAKNPRGFTKDGGRPGRGGFGKPRGRSFSKPAFGSGQLFKAVCSQCREDCMVPFEPLDGRPVYCNNCFKKNDRADRDGGSRDERPSFRKSAPRTEFAPRTRETAAPAKDYSKELAEINKKLDHILTVLADLEIDTEEEKD